MEGRPDFGGRKRTGKGTWLKKRSSGTRSSVVVELPAEPEYYAKPSMSTIARSGFLYFLAKCLPSWLPSPEIRTALHGKPFLPVGLPKSDAEKRLVVGKTLQDAWRIFGVHIFRCYS